MNIENDLLDMNLALNSMNKELKEKNLELYKENERLGNELQVQIEDNVRLNEYIEKIDIKDIEFGEPIKEKEPNYRDGYIRGIYRARNIIDSKQKEIERLNNIINKALEKSKGLQYRFGYVLDDLIYLLMQGSDKE